jgi:hypothetical protein
MFDVFYSGKKPGVFAHEKSAESFEHAQSLSRTRYFWWITYLADYTGFDFLWEPVPWQSEFTHAWPSQWHNHSGTYLVPRTGAVDNYHFHTQTIPNRPHAKPYKFLVKDVEFDTSWVPHPHDPAYNYVFGNQWWPGNIMPTVEYHVPGATQTKYIDTPQARLLEKHANRWHKLVNCAWDHSWCPDPGDSPYIYVFGNQWWPAEKMPTVEYHVPGAIERKYVNWPRAELLEDRTAWTVPANIDESTVDFSWQPDPGDPPYIYQFATQHQRTGGPTYTVPGAVEIKYVDQIRARVDSNATAVYEIDHLCGSAGQIPGTTKTVRYFDNYRDTLIRIAKSIGDQHEFVWICSSICDYTDFDFSWHPEQWQATMLHVFRSNNQKFGDTFFMHVPTFAARAEKKELLEWYDVNFVDIRVPRRPMPVIVHDNDSQVDAIKNTEWKGPIATFTNHDYVPGTMAVVPLWREQTKAIVPISDGAGSVVVPRTAVPYIKTQLYDYPYIDRSQRVLQDPPLDIVFISNGEINAGVYLEHLQWTKNSTRVAANQIHHVSGVNGRVAAYQAAARQSTTPWFFAVFAKLEVTRDFDWSWQPDRMQQAKHYIFHAYNPVNGLVYGHQAMIAYNKRLVLENTGEGLDFTLDQPHEVVPIVSGTAMYHESDWMCWRTAFREVLKLKASLPDVESEHRLNRWLTVDTTEGEWSRKGAEDGVEYYDSVAGDFAALKKSYEWEWLASYAFMKRSLTTNQ